MYVHQEGELDPEISTAKWSRVLRIPRSDAYRARRMRRMRLIWQRCLWVVGMVCNEGIVEKFGVCIWFSVHRRLCRKCTGMELYCSRSSCCGLNQLPKLVVHITEHFESSDEPAVLTCSATRAASVNASFTPRLRMAEHSMLIVSRRSECLVQGASAGIAFQPGNIPRYLSAPIRLATSRPSL